MKSVVFLHAHPDDEALLSGGTLRALHQKGIRTVVIFLTNGQLGLADTSMKSDLGATRKHEALASARILGVSQTYFLDYQDSGLDMQSALPQNSGTTLEEMCHAVEKILENESPSTLIGYDAHGGYGHPDHKLVHMIVRRLAESSDIPTVLEVTIDRSVIASTLDRWAFVISLLGRFKIINPKSVLQLADGFSAHADIAYHVDVRPYAAAKRSSLKAHYSQATGGIRNLRVMTLLPLFAFKRFFGTEWFVAIRDSKSNPLKLFS